MKILMLALLATCSIAMSTQIVQARTLGACTDWKMKGGQSCIFNGGSAYLYVRECTHKYDLEEVCIDENPNKLNSFCGPWEKVSGAQCHSGLGYETKWVRVCTHSLYRTEFCSNSINPNNLEE